MQCGCGGQRTRARPRHSACMDAATVDWRPDTVFVQAGASARDARVAGLGLRWSWRRSAAVWGGRLTGATEVSAGRWSSGVVSTQATVREHPVQWGLMPLARWQPSPGAPAVFVEAGLGLSWHDRTYRVEQVRQGSRLNFQEVIALGVIAGPGQALSVRLSHMSNAGWRKPNPGETWWSLRWEIAF